jgi:murein DD-endopeptidase MepM/ murein hydrolase activator NlpD
MSELDPPSGLPRRRPAKRNRPDPRPEQFALHVVALAALFGVAVLATVFLAPRWRTARPAKVRPSAAAAAAPAATVGPAAASPEPTPQALRWFAVEGDVCALAFRFKGGVTASIRDALPDEYKENAGTVAERLLRALRWQLDPKRDFRREELIKIAFNPAARAERVPLYGFWRQHGRDGRPQFFIYYPQVQKTPSPYYDETGACIAETMEQPPLAPADMEHASVESLGAQGLYFDVPRNTNVILPFAGRVLRVNWDMPALGRSVEVRYSENDALAWFAHLDMLGEKTAEGATLAAGDIVGLAGDTGRAKGTGFLYRTFRQSGDAPPQAVSPLELHESNRAEIPAAERVNFIAVRDKLERLFARVDAPD